MIAELEGVQARIQLMRESLLTEGSVNGIEECGISHIEAKKKVIWYLDLFAAAVAGAHRHISNLEQDDCLSEVEKDEMTQKVLERLRKELGVLPPVIKDYFYCLGKHFDTLDAYDPPPSLNGYTPEALDSLVEKRLIVRETLAQLELLDQEADDIRDALSS